MQDHQDGLLLVVTRKSSPLFIFLDLELFEHECFKRKSFVCHSVSLQDYLNQD